MSIPPQIDPGFRLGEVYKLWYPKKVEVKDGLTFRYRLWDKYDTAIYYTTGADTFDVTTTFKKISGNKPPVILPDIISTIDDNVVVSDQGYAPSENAGDNIFVLAGWSHFKNQTWNESHHGKTFSFVDGVEGAYIELTFTGYKVDWYSEKRENHGIMSVQKLKQLSLTVKKFGLPTEPRRTWTFTIREPIIIRFLVWTSPAGMPNATTKFRFNYTGRKNSAATQTNVGHDKFIIYRKQ